MCTWRQFAGSLMAASLLVLASCAPPAGNGSSSGTSNGDKLASVARQDPDSFLVVDCLLPAQVRQLGRLTSYLAPRRALKTAKGECELRGGEYVSYDRADLGTALKVWLADAQSGDPKAQTYVGEIFDRGVGGTADPAAALQWYEKAAAQGYTPAMINLGQIYEQGRGVAKDTVKALNYYRQASGLGVAFVASADTAAEITGLRQELSERDRELVALKAEVGSLEQRLEAEQRKRKSAAAEAKEREAAVAAMRRDVAKEEARLAELRSSLPPDAAELVAERQRLAEKSRALADLDGSLKAWSSRLESETARLADSKAEAASRAQLETELAAARADLERAQSSLAEAKAAQAAAQAAAESAARDAASQALSQAEAAAAAEAARADAARFEQLSATLASWEEELQRRETALAEAPKDEVAFSEVSFSVADTEPDWLIEAKGSIEQGRQALQLEQVSLTSRESQLSEKEKELSTLDSALQFRLDAVSTAEAQLAERRQQIQLQEAAFNQRQDELAHLDTQIKTLNAEAEKKLQALSVFIAGDASVLGSDDKSGDQGKRPDAATGPQITMIDPPLDTRSVGPRRSIRVRATVGERPIIGRVQGDSAVLSVVVNDAEVPVNESGVFRATVPISATTTPVQIVAIDKAGRRTALDFTVEREAILAPATVAGVAGNDNTIMPPMKSPPMDLGRFYALVIGNNAYTKLPRLETAKNDVEAVAGVLRKRYGFEVIHLEDATRYDILNKLNELRQTLTDKDNLLIYYAGHGELDAVNQRGYWLPVDAEPDSTANWISNVQITDILNAMSAKRIIVVADSCYSGSLTRSSLARLEAGMTLEAREAWITALAGKKARMALTSGGLAPVLDAGGGSNSIFAKAFIDVLNGNNDVLEGQRLYQQVAAVVTYAADSFSFEQVPQYAPIKFAGHESGEFFFVPKS